MKHKFLKWLLNQRLIANKGKKKTKEQLKAKITYACDFCLLLFNQGIVCDDNVVFFTTETFLFQLVTICIQWHSASSKTWMG